MGALGRVTAECPGHAPHPVAVLREIPGDSVDLPATRQPSSATVTATGLRMMSSTGEVFWT